jgi:hypothetical protein
MRLESDHHGCAMQGICNSLNLVLSHRETASPYTRFWHFRSIFRYFCVKMAGILSSVSGGMEFGHFAARPGNRN